MSALKEFITSDLLNAKFLFSTDEIKYSFLKALQKYYQLLILGTFNMSGYFHQEPKCQLVETEMFICMQKINFISPTSFMRYCKTFQTFCFGNFGNACPSQQKSLYQFEGNFQAYLLQLQPTFFLKYFKEIANLYFGQFGHALLNIKCY